MKKRNKCVIGGIVLISVLGLMILMIILFMILRTYLKEDKMTVAYKIEEDINRVDTSVELSETFLIVVHKITDKRIEGYEITNQRMMIKPLSEITRSRDTYGNVMPLKEIKRGDIIEVECSKESTEVHSLNKSAAVHTWRDISGVTVDLSDKAINVGGAQYKYTDNTMIIDEKGEEKSIKEVGPYNIVTIQVYDNIVWSIKISQSAATISLQDVPQSKGTLEIDYSRLLQFEDITEPINIVPGKHQIVVRMEGYEVITKDIELESGESYKLSLKEAKKAYTDLHIMMYTEVEDYEIQIKDKSYKPGEKILLEQGKYEVIIRAEGYKEWRREVLLKNKTHALHVMLVSLDEDKDSALPEESQTEKLEITLTTEPLGAKVYIDGVLSGQTPYIQTLERGSHTVLFEKEGYALYTVNLQLGETSQDQTYLYRLIPENE